MTKNTSVILIDLLYNATELYHVETLVECNTAIVGTSQLPHVTKSNDNTAID
jgi:hypothetical protein